MVEPCTLGGGGGAVVRVIRATQKSDANISQSRVALSLI